MNSPLELLISKTSKKVCREHIGHCFQFHSSELSPDSARHTKTFWYPFFYICAVITEDILVKRFISSIRENVSLKPFWRRSTLIKQFTKLPTAILPAIPVTCLTLLVVGPSSFASHISNSGLRKGDETMGIKWISVVGLRSFGQIPGYLIAMHKWNVLVQVSAEHSNIFFILV